MRKPAVTTIIALSILGSLVSCSYSENMNDLLETASLTDNLSIWELYNYALQKEKEVKLLKTINIHSLGLLIPSVILMSVFCIRVKKKETRNFSESSKELSSVRAKLSELEKIHSSSTEQMRIDYIKLYHAYFNNILKTGKMISGIEVASNDNLRLEMGHMARIIYCDKEGQEMLEKEIDDKMYGIMSNFKHDIPGLKEEDYILTRYLFAGFEQAMICQLMHAQSPEAIYMRKVRIKKKIRQLEDSNTKKQLYLELLG